MSKKDFSAGLSSLLGEGPAKKRPGPDRKAETPKRSAKQGTLPGETRATFIVSDDTLTKVKALAYWQRCMIKDVVETALQDAIAKHEKDNGPLDPIP